MKINFITLKAFLFIELTKEKFMLRKTHFSERSVIQSTTIENFVN